jgi:outer membrane immunogenic protein
VLKIMQLRNLIIFFRGFAAFSATNAHNQIAHASGKELLQRQSRAVSATEIVMRYSLVLAAFVAAAGLPGTAFAADIIDPQPAPAPAPVYDAQDQNWSGIYLGVLLGYTFGDADIAGGPSVDLDGVDGGIYAGYNYQIDNFVIGLEGDALISGAEGSGGGVNVDQNWSGSLRARAGYSLESFLLYGTGGLAVAGFEASSAGNNDSNTHLGWTVGAGIEGMVTDNVAARLEYRYTDYEDKNYGLGAPTNIDPATNSVRAGVGVKF